MPHRSWRTLLLLLLTLGADALARSSAGHAEPVAVPAAPAAPCSALSFRPGPGSPAAVGHFPRSVVVGDFNGDGVRDLATANNGNNTVTVLLGYGGGEEIGRASCRERV